MKYSEMSIEGYRVAAGEEEAKTFFELDDATADACKMKKAGRGSIQLFYMDLNLNKKMEYRVGEYDVEPLIQSLSRRLNAVAELRGGNMPGFFFEKAEKLAQDAASDHINDHRIVDREKAKRFSQLVAIINNAAFLKDERCIPILEMLMEDDAKCSPFKKLNWTNWPDTIWTNKRLVPGMELEHVKIFHALLDDDALWQLKPSIESRGVLLSNISGAVEILRRKNSEAIQPLSEKLSQRRDAFEKLLETSKTKHWIERLLGD